MSSRPRPPSARSSTTGSTVRRRRLAATAVVGALVVTTAGLGTVQASAASARAAAPSGVRLDGGAYATPIYLDASRPVGQRVADLLSRMSLAEKIGQMTQAERGGVDTADPADLDKIATDRLGSLLSGGGSTPKENNPAAWADMVDRYQKVALSTRLAIPIIYGIDTVHGDGNVLGATVFPHNIGLGATRDPDLVRRVAHIAAKETRATGPQWAFAPCLCVARDDRWGRTYESFGESPRLVKRMETAIDGLQGPPGHLADNDRVLATAKHLAGDGLTTYGTGSNNGTTGDYTIDQGVTEVSRADFDRLALSPYIPAVRDHHVGAVMPSYSDVDFTDDGLGNRVNMHANKEVINGWLKGAQQFKGFVISDYEGIHHINPDTFTYRQQVQAGVEAGIDMFMEPFDFENFASTLTSLVEDGTVPMARIDDAVSRILRAKFQLGLFEHPYTDRTHLAQVGSPRHRAVARRAVQESQVLLRNRRAALPIAPGRKVYVAGSNADNIGNQAGGWTLTWQGGSTNVIPGQTILDGIRATGRRVTFSEDASTKVPYGAVGVVVVGERPFSEGFGDVGAPGWAYDPADNGHPRPSQTMQLNANDRLAIDRVCSRASRCVVVVVSGRPVIVAPRQLRQIDALVASWLPGSEGQGVADVLFGHAPFTGRLPVSWPRNLAQEPINIGDRDYDPLFRFGHGLATRVARHHR